MSFCTITMVTTAAVTDWKPPNVRWKRAKTSPQRHSCDHAWPYYRIVTGDTAYNIAVGWPGSWQAWFEKASYGVHVEAKQEYTLEEAVAMAQQFIEDGDKASDAAKKAAALSGLKKNDIYRELNK